MNSVLDFDWLAPKPDASGVNWNRDC